jgi:ABC-2 type transport system permease protein
LIFGSYYLLPKLINVSVLDHISLISHWWSWFLPPVWIAALNELLIHSTRAGVITIVLAAVGILTPMIGLWMVVNVFAPGFNKKLAAISTSDDSSNSAVNTKRAGKFTFIDKIAAIVAPDPVENAGFKITWKLSARLREFKLKVYPAFAYVPIYFLYFMLNGKGDVTTRLNALQNGHAYIFLVYLCTFILSTILMNISMTEKYKSSWIYYAAPIGEPGKILSGMYKAIIVLYFLPYCLVIGIVTIAIWGPQAINDLLLAMSVCVTYGMIMALFTVKGLPFSRPVVAKQGGGRVITSLVILGLIFGIGYGHYCIMQWETVVWILIIPAILLNLIMFHYYKKQTWNNIELADID